MHCNFVTLTTIELEMLCRNSYVYYVLQMMKLHFNRCVCIYQKIYNKIHCAVGGGWFFFFLLCRTETSDAAATTVTSLFSLNLLSRAILHLSSMHTNIKCVTDFVCVFAVLLIPQKNSKAKEKMKTKEMLCIGSCSWRHSQAQNT